MGKLKKNQPGYTQDKDKNGRTIWVPDGSQSASSGSASGGLTDVVEDFSEVEEDRSEDRDDLVDEAASETYDFFSDNGAFNELVHFDTNMGELSQQVAEKCVDEYLNGNAVTFKDVASDMGSVVIDFDNPDNVFADEANGELMRRDFGKYFDVDEGGKTVSFGVEELFEKNNIMLQRMIDDAAFVSQDDGSINDDATNDKIRQAVCDSMKNFDIQGRIDQHINNAVNRSDFDDDDEYDEAVDEEADRYGDINADVLEEFIMNDMGYYVNVKNGKIDANQALEDLLEKF